MTVEISKGMIAEASQLDPIINGSDHPNPRILDRAELIDIARFSQMIAYHDKSSVAARLLKRPKNLQHVIFRLKAANDKIVAFREEIHSKSGCAEGGSSITSQP